MTRLLCGAGALRSQQLRFRGGRAPGSFRRRRRVKCLVLADIVAIFFCPVWCLLLLDAASTLLGSIGSAKHRSAMITSWTLLTPLSIFLPTANFGIQLRRRQRCDVDRPGATTSTGLR